MLFVVLGLWWGLMAVLSDGGPFSVSGRPTGDAVVSLIAGAMLVGGLNQRRHEVTCDGRSVTVRRQWTSTEFRLDQVRWVIDPVTSLVGPVRVDRPTRFVGPVRVPVLTPWPTLVATCVSPWTWVRELGVPIERVRGGGVTWRRRGLR